MTIFRSDVQMKCKSCGLEKDPSLFYTSNKSNYKECSKDDGTKEVKCTDYNADKEGL